MIFIDKRESNDDLLEITDAKLILQVKESLKLNEKCDDYVPIICGSVVSGGFTRKLQMLRNDLFSVLSVA